MESGLLRDLFGNFSTRGEDIICAWREHVRWTRDEIAARGENGHVR